MKCAVIGAGSWGTALADLLCRNGHEVSLWVREPEVLESLKKTGRNLLFLPDFEVCRDINFSSSFEETLHLAELVVLAIPSGFLRSVLSSIKHLLSLQKPLIVNVAKGLEHSSGKTLSRVIFEELEIEENSPEDKLAILSGPNIAFEVASGKPAATVIAAPTVSIGETLQKVFSSSRFRVYRHDDRIGVELGGTFKNVFAVGAGLVEGLGLGDNAKAAYLTRSLHEMVRLGTALGGRKTTFYGLSGLGDLMTTAFSPFSRNHQLGLAIARGEKELFLEKNKRMAIEGIETTRLAREWGKKLTISVPITEEISRVLFENKSPTETISDLMGRSLKCEEE